MNQIVVAVVEITVLIIPIIIVVDVVDAEEHDERNIKRIVIGVCKDGVIPRTVNPLHAERALNERDKEAIGAHEADER